jgi:hypothetical protein
VSTHINEDSIKVFCKMLMDALEVNPDARPAFLSVIDTLLDNNVPQE